MARGLPPCRPVLRRRLPCADHNQASQAGTPGGPQGSCLMKTLLQPKRLALALAALAPLSATSAYGEEETLAPVVVTASRQPSRVQDLLADVTVINREQLDEAGHSSVAEVLARQPGIQVASNGGEGKTTSLFIRGANPNQTLLLIDGLRAGSATTGYPSLDSLPLSQIDHIEIVRGPASALYGADAIGGVIQIFTKKGSGAPRVTASAGAGSFGLQDYSAGISGGTEAVSYAISAGYRDFRGFNVSKPYNPNYNPDKDGYTNTSASGSLALRPTHGQELGLQFLYAKAQNHYDYSSQYLYDDHADNTTSSLSIYSRNKITDIWQSTLRLGRSEDRNTNFYSPLTPSYLGGPRSEFNTTQDLVSWQNDITLPVGRLMAGYEQVNQQVSSTTKYQNTGRSIDSFFAGWNARLGDHRVQLNLRNDNNSQFGNHTTGLASYGYQITTSIRGSLSYGTGFKAPTFNDLYYPGFSNPNLAPEKSENIEAGLYWESTTANLSLVTYQNTVSNLIVLDQNWIPANINRAQLTGATLAGNVRIGNWNLGGSYDHLDPVDRTTGKQLGRRAKDTGTLRASYGIAQNWQVGSEVQLVGRRFDTASNTRALGGYGIVNLFARYALSKDLSLEARANNLGNKDYETAYGYRMPPATFFLSLRYTPTK